MSEVGKVVLQLLKDEPAEWEQTSHTFINKKRKIELWTHHGVCLLQCYPASTRFGLLERVKIWRAIDRVRAYNLMQPPFEKDEESTFVEWMSKKTLEMVDQAAKNFKKGKVSEPIDLDKHL